METFKLLRKEWGRNHLLRIEFKTVSREVRNKCLVQVDFIAIIRKVDIKYVIRMIRNKERYAICVRSICFYSVTK